MAAGTLLATDDEDAKGRYLPGIASGDLIGTVALYGDDGRPTLANSSLVARKGPESWLLDGHKSFVIDGHIADLILAVADTPEGLSLFAVSGSAPGLTRTSLLTMDQTRKQARLEFGATPATLIGLAGTAEVPMKTALERVAVALANEQVGGAQHCLDSSVEYAKVRVQFGRPIGSFQAIKHKCADLLMEIEMARSAAYYAAQVASADSDELPAVASLAKSFCSETYTKAASENIQIHGGIGFTWEHGAHLYFKRAKSSELLFGDPDFHRNLLADEIGI
jgi:alkylation response protein AidB-like acyl-CoA dehydrogenase